MGLSSKDLWSQNTNQGLLSSSMSKWLTWIEIGERVEEMRRG